MFVDRPTRREIRTSPSRVAGIAVEPGRAYRFIRKESSMPSRKSLASHHARGVHPMPPGVLGYAEAMTPPSDAELCERAVQAIWHSLDEHDLVDEQVRRELAAILEPLLALGLGERAQRLIKTLRLPDPIDASHLYWLTRRLLTFVPELQSTASALSRQAGDRSPPLA
jgi:hypothetical protein